MEDKESYYSDNISPDGAVDENLKGSESLLGQFLDRY